MTASPERPSHVEEIGVRVIAAAYLTLVSTVQVLDAGKAWLSAARMRLDGKSPRLIECSDPDGSVVTRVVED